MQLWCNHYEAFNDPFECWCIEKTGIPNPETELERFDNVAKTWGFPSGNDVSKEDLFEYCSEFDHEYSMRVSHYIDSARISCFSKRVDNLLMWSHYADGLRGFCIEFDKKELLKDQELNSEVHEVLYRIEPAVLDTMVYEVAKDQVWYHEMAIDGEEKMRKYVKDYKPDNLLPEYRKALTEAHKLLFELYTMMLCSKPDDWKYEEEVRLIKHTDSGDKKGEPFNYPRSAIKRVFVGEKASKENIQIIKDILQNSKINVPIKRVSRDKNSYKIIVD